MGLEEDLKAKNKELAEENKLLRRTINFPNPNQYDGVKIDFPEDHVKFLAFADAHMGHKCYRPDIMEKMGKDAKRQHCDFAINAGDTIEGMSGRDGHFYELTHFGATEQMDYFVEQFAKLRLPVYSIEAQDSHGGWFHSKGNMGLDIGKELELRCDNYKFLGYDEQDLLLENGLKIRLRHPGGGTAYSLSYKLQRYIESISGGQKPEMLFQGHFHKSEYLFYRNIHAYDAGTLCEQTPFMKKIGTPAHMGYWIVDVKINKNGDRKTVERVNNQFVPFFE